MQRALYPVALAFSRSTAGTTTAARLAAARARATPSRPHAAMSSSSSPKAATPVSVEALELPADIYDAGLVERVHALWFAGLPAGATAPSAAALARWYGLGTAEEREGFDGELRAAFMPALDALSPERVSLDGFTEENYTAGDASRDARLVAPLLRRRALWRRASAVEGSGNGAKEEDGATRARAALALVILLDQVPRNALRTREGQRRVYTHYDVLSRALARTCLREATEGDDATCSSDDRPLPAAALHGVYEHASIGLSAAHLQWFLLPLMHHESLAAHDEFYRVIDERLDAFGTAGDTAAIEALQKTRDFGRRHTAILERFGRYPHRNAALGRETSPEERRWLTEGGDTFGAG